MLGKYSANQIIKGLALDDATTAKFIPVYKQYMEEMRATRHMGACRNIANRTAADKQTPQTAFLQMLKWSRLSRHVFAQSRKILDVRESIIMSSGNFFSPKQIQKMYNMEKHNGDKFRKEMRKRQGMKKQHDGRRHMPQGDVKK